MATRDGRRNAVFALLVPGHGIESFEAFFIVEHPRFPWHLTDAHCFFNLRCLSRCSPSGCPWVDTGYDSAYRLYGWRQYQRVLHFGIMRHAWLACCSSDSSQEAFERYHGHGWRALGDTDSDGGGSTGPDLPR